MTKSTFRSRGRPDKSASCSYNKHARHMGQQTPTGDNVVIATVWSSIQTQELQVFFPRKGPQQIPNV